MADRVPGILRNLRIKRVALVDEGANFDAATGDGAHIMLYKSKNPPSTPTIIKEKPVMKTIKEILKSVLDTILEPDIEKRKLALGPLSKAVDGLEDPTPTTPITPVVPVVAKVAHDASDAMCKCGDCMSKRTDAEKAVNAEVEKRMGSIAKQNEDLAKANTALAASVAKMQDDVATTEMTTILKSFKHTPFKLTGDDSDVVKFKKMKAADPSGWERMLEIFKAQDAQMGNAFITIGSSLSGGKGDAWGELEALAEALVTKSTTPLTQAQALDQVMMNPKNNSIVKRYREQQQ